MDLESLNPDSVEEVLARNGVLSITLSDAGDKPVLEPAPGETPLWRNARDASSMAKRSFAKTAPVSPYGEVLSTN